MNYDENERWKWTDWFYFHFLISFNLVQLILSSPLSSFHVNFSFFSFFQLSTINIDLKEQKKVAIVTIEISFSSILFFCQFCWFSLFLFLLLNNWFIDNNQFTILITFQINFLPLFFVPQHYHHFHQSNVKITTKTSSIIVTNKM